MREFSIITSNTITYPDECRGQLLQEFTRILQQPGRQEGVDHAYAALHHVAVAAADDRRVRDKREAAVQKLVERHFEVESGLVCVFHITDGTGSQVSPDSPVRLLEVNEGTVECGVMPLHFGPVPAFGIPFPVVIVEVTPREFARIMAGELNLPTGWVVGPKVHRAASPSAGPFDRVAHVERLLSHLRRDLLAGDDVWWHACCPTVAGEAVRDKDGVEWDAPRPGPKITYTFVIDRMPDPIPVVTSDSPSAEGGDAMNLLAVAERVADRHFEPHLTAVSADPASGRLIVSFNPAVLDLPATFAELVRSVVADAAPHPVRFEVRSPARLAAGPVA